jgi:hypothetical protein
MDHRHIHAPAMLGTLDLPVVHVCIIYLLWKARLSNSVMAQYSFNFPLQWCMLCYYLTDNIK